MSGYILFSLLAPIIGFIVGLIIRKSKKKKYPLEDNYVMPELSDVIFSGRFKESSMAPFVVAGIVFLVFLLSLSIYLIELIDSIFLSILFIILGIAHLILQIVTGKRLQKLWLNATFIITQNSCILKTSNKNINFKLDISKIENITMSSDKLLIYADNQKYIVNYIINYKKAYDTLTLLKKGIIPTELYFKEKQTTNTSMDSPLVNAIDENNKTNFNDIPDTILKYKKLQEQGIITQEEFDKIKNKLLNL